MTRVYVGNLDPRVSDRDLEDEFRMFGVLRRFELFMPIILVLNELLILMDLMAVFGLLGDHRDMPLLNLTITGMLWMQSKDWMVCPNTTYDSLLFS